MRIDHVILQSADLDATAARLLSEHDLGSVPGGRHPAWGTANRIVPAGPSYVELMGVGDPDVAHGTDLGRWVLSGTASGDRLAAVCLRTDDLDAVCDRLGLRPTEGRRTTPDGTTLTWRQAGMDRMVAEGLPFFITWGEVTGADVADPEEGSRALGIEEVTLGGDVAAWVGEDVPGLRTVGGEPGVREVVLRTAGGTVRIG